MRLLSIVALCSVVYATYVPSTDSEPAGKLKPRAICPAGQGNNGQNRCVPCIPGTYSIGGFSFCLSCPAGSTSDAGASACTTCTPGYRINPMRVTVLDPYCVACPPGQSSTGNNASACTPCPANTYSTLPGGTCASCAAGMISSPGSMSCTRSCPAGKRPFLSICMDCPAGSYSTAGSTDCTDCPPGQVSDPGSSSCTACPPGRVPNGSGRNCATCDANTYANGNVCSPCPLGSTSPAGSSSCGPQPSKQASPPVRREEETCTWKPGYMWCPVLSGKRGNECIDVLSTLDSCGGCVVPGGDEDEYTGKDCSAISNVDEVKCHQGRCEITSCKSGYVKSQGVCAPALGHTIKSRRAATFHPRHESF